MKKRKVASSQSKKTKRATPRSRSENKEGSNQQKSNELPKFSFLISLIDDIELELRSHLESENEPNDEFREDFIDLEIILLELEIILIKILWLLYPNRYYGYVRALKNANRISNCVFALTDLLEAGEINFYLGFLDISNLQINSHVIKRYNSVKIELKKLVKNTKRKERKLELLSDKLSKIGRDFADFWDQSKYQKHLSEIVIEEFGLENPRNIMWYFELTCQFYEYVIPPSETLAEDRIELISALHTQLEIKDDEDREVAARMIDEIVGFGFESLAEEDDEDYLNKSDYDPEFEHFVTHLEADEDQEAEMELIKSHPENYSCFFVIIASGVESMLAISLFIRPLNLEAASTNPTSVQPFEAFLISWEEFDNAFIAGNADWQNYSKAKLNKVMEHASGHAVVNAIEYITEILSELKVTNVTFTMTKRVLVDFDELGTKSTSQFPKKFRLTLGEILKDKIIKEITQLGHETTYVDMNEEEYLEKHDFSDPGSTYR